MFQSPKQKQTALEAEVKRLQGENKLMKQLATAVGFYHYYFKELNNHVNNIECFNAVNDLHFDLFGEYRYSSWDSFRHSKIYRNKK